MSKTEKLLSFVRDARLGVHATSGNPVWLWSADGREILWANANGAAIFGGESSAAIVGRRFEADQLAASQIARLAGALTLGASPRLEMLRGFGAGFGRTLLCACSRIAFADRSAILVVASQPAGPNLTLNDRVRRMLADVEDAIATFAPAGRLIHTTPAAAHVLGAHTTLDSIGAAPLAVHARNIGHADGESEIGPITLQRLGEGTNTVLLATFPEAKSSAASAPSAIEAMPVSAEAPRERRQVERTPAITDPSTDAAVQTPAPEIERRYPLRFVWQMDSSGRFTIGSDEFAHIVGARLTAGSPRLWSELSTELGLDPKGLIDSAIASRDTWSGITLSWPVEGTAERLDVELSGLPIFDRDRTYRGYRGFGVCREIERIAELLKQRLDGRQHAIPRAATPHVPQPPVPPKIAEDRPALSIVPPPARNILPFPTNAENKPAVLSPVERNAFSELAKQLSARLRDGEEEQSTRPPTVREDVRPAAAEAASSVIENPERSKTTPARQSAFGDERPILDRLPVGVLVYHHERMIFGNRAFLDWAGHENLAGFEDAGGLESLFLEAVKDPDGSRPHAGQALLIEAPDGDKRPTEGRLVTIPWEGGSAMALMLMPAPPARRTESAQKTDDSAAILDAISDGVLILNADGRIQTSNHAAQIMFGLDARELSARSIIDLLAPDCRAAVATYLKQAGPSNVFNDGLDIGIVGRSNTLPAFLTIGQFAGPGDRYCAVLRDRTQWKKTEDDLVAAKRQAERASSTKSEFLAKVSHEIRTPLNAIIGFSEVMMAERFGPIGNDRYRDYLKDIHASGQQLILLLNDLLDLSKIETGKYELNFDRLNLNDLTQQTVATMQPEASRERIIIRTSLPAALPQVVADPRAVRQIIQNLLANSIELTEAGGQVIVSTAVNDNGDVVLRVRDTSTGLSDKDIETALEPFRALATRVRGAGTGLSLPLTKALAEANRASFSIKSAAATGTLIEIAFPQAPLAAQ